MSNRSPSPASSDMIQVEMAPSLPHDLADELSSSEAERVDSPSKSEGEFVFYRCSSWNTLANEVSLFRTPFALPLQPRNHLPNEDGSPEDPRPPLDPPPNPDRDRPLNRKPSRPERN